VSDLLLLAQAFAEVGRVVEDTAYAIEDGCVENLEQVGFGRGSASARNWIATVTPDRRQPGGLRRVFWTKGQKPWHAFPNLAAGDVIEMAGDLLSLVGRRTWGRRYVMVVRVEETYFVGLYLGAQAPSAKAIERACHKIRAMHETKPSEPKARS
jgi:hypothetical protein